MSRFIFINKKERFDIEKVLTKFSELSENNPTPEGNWQGDGWGISWIDPYMKWREFKTFVSIWKNKDFFHIFMPSNTFMLNVRTLEREEAYISEEKNMPYISEELSFIFDGELQDAGNYSDSKLPEEKYWEKIQALNKENFENEFRDFCVKLDLGNENLKAANLALCIKNKLYIYCSYRPEYENYFQTRFVINDNKIVFSSQEIEIENIKNEDWQRMNNGEFKSIELFENLTS